MFGQFSSKYLFMYKLALATFCHFFEALWLLFIPTSGPTVNSQHHGGLLPDDDLSLERAKVAAPKQLSFFPIIKNGRHFFASEIKRLARK